LGMLQNSRTLHSLTVAQSCTHETHDGVQKA
jgi:hypothetical protein